MNNQNLLCLEKVMAPHSSTLAWKIPWMEEPGGLQSMGSRKARHDWATSLSLFTFMHWRRKWQPTPVFLPGESQGRGSLVGCQTSMGSHRVGHDWSDLAAAAATVYSTWNHAQCYVAACTFYYYYYYCHVICGILFPNQESNLLSLHWKLRVLTTGWPRKSLFSFLLLNHFWSCSLITFFPSNFQSFLLVGVSAVFFLHLVHDSNPYW